MSGHLNAFSGKHVDIRAVDQVVLKSQIIPSSAAVLKLEGEGRGKDGGGIRTGEGEGKKQNVGVRGGLTRRPSSAARVVVQRPR